MKEKERSLRPAGASEAQAGRPKQQTDMESATAADSLDFDGDKSCWPHAIIEEVHRLLEMGKLTEASRLILDSAINVTQGEFGFVGLVLDGGLLRLLVHSGFKWHETANREFYDSKMQSYAENGYLDFEESGNLISAVVSEKKPIVTNSPAEDPRSGGLPPGHPPLHCFLGVPAIEGDEVVGMIGIANRPRGFAQAEFDLVVTLVPAVVDVYHSYSRMEREGRLKMSRASGHR